MKPKDPFDFGHWDIIPVLVSGCSAAYWQLWHSAAGKSRRVGSDLSDPIHINYSTRGTLRFCNETRNIEALTVTQPLGVKIVYVAADSPELAMLYQGQRVDEIPEKMHELHPASFQEFHRLFVICMADERKTHFILITLCPNDSIKRMWESAQVWQKYCLSSSFGAGHW